MGSVIKKVNCIIKDGPDREMLFDALKHACNKEVIIPIRFTLIQDNGTEARPIKTKNTKITSISRDGDNTSGHAFVIGGKMDVCFHPEVSGCDDLCTTFRTLMFNACYDSQTHRGRLTFTMVVQA